MNTTTPLITILGAGSWGTALAILLARSGRPVRLWGRGDYVEEMKISRCNKRYLPDVALPDNIEIFTDFAAAIANINDVLIAVPSHAFRSVVTDLQQLKPSNIRIAWATKGLDPESNQLLHQVVFEICGEIPIAILAGPSFAREVAIGLPTAVTLTTNNILFGKDIISRLHSQNFRIYTQPDLIGVQICGAIKNGLAVATGISDGLRLGANARAALITRGLAEMARLGVAMGGHQETFMGLAGLGDLVLTCTDNQSRNRRFGFALGQGIDIKKAEEDIGQVVEGKQNALMVYKLANQYQVEMPIIESVCKVLQQQMTPAKAVEKLLSRGQKQEHYH